RLTRQQLEADHSVSPDDTAAVKRVLGRYGLTVSDAAAATGSLVVSGTAAQIEAAFAPGLGVYRTAGGREVRGREGHVKIPRALPGVVTGVFGLDERRVARRRVRERQGGRARSISSQQPLGPADLERRYRFPEGRGEGQAIAIAQFGGGYFPADLRRYCHEH